MLLEKRFDQDVRVGNIVPHVIGQGFTIDRRSEREPILLVSVTASPIPYGTP